MNQFDADDERVGHQRLLDAIRAERVRELDAIRAWDTLQVVQTIETWCCDWHRYHSQEDK